MKSERRFSAKAITIANAYPGEAAALLQRYLICARAFVVAAARFRKVVEAVGIWTLREIDPLALLARGDLAIAAPCLLGWFDASRIAGLRARPRRRVLPPTDNGISGMSARKRPASNRVTTAVSVLCLGLTAAPATANSFSAAGADTVRSFYEALLANMRSGPALGARGRYSRIEPVVRRTFDMPFMTRLAVGPEWERLDDAQRQQVSQAFERYISAIYADRFDSYSGERLQVTGEQPSPGGTLITTEIVKSNGEPVRLNYLMRQNGSAWQIADVYLNGTISELATRRSEFSSILRAQGIDGLIAMLNNKAESLAARAS
jgi:phospholipid transport system substrate-binding protein